MTAEIYFISNDNVSVLALAHQIASQAHELDAMIAVVRNKEGFWTFLNTSGLDNASMSMAALVVTREVTDKIFDQ